MFTDIHETYQTEIVAKVDDIIKSIINSNTTWKNYISNTLISKNLKHMVSLNYQ